MKTILTLVFILAINLTVFSQSKQLTEKNSVNHEHKYSYAYISVEGKLFSKKLKVEVDFGDSPEQIKIGKEYSEVLTNKKSYAAVLNHMVENDFELVETLDYTFIYSGHGGTAGIVFIMKKKVS